MQLSNSPIQSINFRDKKYYIKRDDKIHPIIGGNKVRKLQYYLDNKDLEFDTYIGYGGAQSNLMASLSYIAQQQNKNFIYYIKQLPSYLQNNPQGNFKFALDNNMILKELKHEDYHNIIDNLKVKQNEVLIKQGGLQKEAEYGIRELAYELQEWIKANNIKSPKVFLPSGTGSTALYLQKHLSIQVYTVACVGDSRYLSQQFSTLEKDSALHPTILESNKKYHFAKPYKEFYNIYKELIEETKIEFDMLYDPIGWLTLLDSLNKINGDIIYLHQGGVMGNSSQLQRYNKIL